MNTLRKWYKINSMIDGMDAHTSCTNILISRETPSMFVILTSHQHCLSKCGLLPVRSGVILVDWLHREKADKISAKFNTCLEIYEGNWLNFVFVLCMYIWNQYEIAHFSWFCQLLYLWLMTGTNCFLGSQ